MLKVLPGEDLGRHKMNINLNNYETFFLLYVDNELSAAEKLSVDEFIQQFPYLKKELADFAEMVLPSTDAIIFDKQHLYRSAGAEETMQEAMLLHLDNELAGSAKDDLLKQLKDNKALQQSWNLLKRSRLEVDEAITFPDKSILYRKEKGRIVTGSFVRWAVAAALITAGFFAGISIIKKQDAVVTNISKTSTKKLNNRDNALNNDNLTAIVKEEAVEEKEVKGQVKTAIQKNNNSAVNNAIVAPNDRQKIKPEEEQKKYLVNNKQPINVKKQSPVEINKTDDLNTITVPANNDIAKLEQPLNSNSNSINSSAIGKQKTESIPELNNINIMPVQNSYAKTVVLYDEEQNTNRILFMDEEKLSNSKAGVFFKKIKKTVARHTKITTGNSLKIAGVEFAVN